MLIEYIKKKQQLHFDEDIPCGEKKNYKILRKFLPIPASVPSEPLFSGAGRY